MARRSDYPFRKSDVKFGTNLIATLFSIPISLGARAVIDGSKDLLSTYPTDTAKIPSEAMQGKIGRLEFAIGGNWSYSSSYSGSLLGLSA